MKKVIRYFVLFIMVLQLGIGSLPPTLAQITQPPEGDNMQTVPDGNQGSMPGWPVPDKPIPQHEPGAPSRAASYSTQVTRLNAEGVEEVVTLTGLDAMLADGTIRDPLGGDYRLVSMDKIALGFSTGDSISLSAFENITASRMAGSQFSILANIHSFDLTSGDLNGDGVDEQVTAWVDGTSQNIYMALGEMPGTNGRSSSEPAAAAYGNQVNLLVRGYDQALWQAHFDGSTWGEWNNNGGGLLLSGPAMASRGGAAFDIFAVGADNQTWQRSWDGSNWVGSWVGLPVDAVFTTVPAWVGPPPELETPAAVAGGTDAFDVFRLAPDHTLRWIHFNGAAWGEWQGLGGMLTSGPGAVLLEDGRLQVFAVGVDQALWYRTLNGTWGNWQRVALDGMDPAVSLVSAPTPVLLANGDTAIYGLGSDQDIWQVTYDGAWGSWGQSGVDLASRPAVVVHDSGLALFALAANGSLQTDIDGTWEGFTDPNPWLPACCLETPIDTGIRAYVTGDNDLVDQINVLDVQTGHFLGDSRQQIALAYTWDDPDKGPEVVGNTGVGLQLYDVNDGFRTLVPLGHIDGSQYDEAYYPKIAVGEFNEDGLQEIALAYATRSGGVRVYTNANYQGRELAWLKEGTYIFNSDYDMANGWNNQIRSIQISAGWKACFYNNFTDDEISHCPNGYNYSDLSAPEWDGLETQISRVEVTQVGTDDLDPVNITDGIYKQNNAHIAVEIIGMEPQNPVLTRDAVEYFEMKPADGDHYPAPERTLEIVAGDFDGNQLGKLNDEIAILYDIYCEGDLCDDGYYAYFNILDVENQQITTHDAYPSEERKMVDEWDVDDGVPTADLHLTTGDFDGDGRDEIARTWPTYDVFNGSDWGDIDRSLQVLDWDNGWPEAPEFYELTPSTYHSHQDVLMSGDLNLDLKDEIIFLNSTWNSASATGDLDILQTYTFSPTEGIDLAGSRALPWPIYPPAMLQVPYVLATGDFTGEGIQVGPPNYRVQNQMVTPVMFLNLPPMHRDIIFYDGQNHVIEVINDAEAKYNTASSSNEVYSTESKREWDLSTGFNMSVGGGGHKVKTSLENTYGENFSKATSQITERVTSDQTTASIFDQIIYNGTDYAIWEYPVLGTEADDPDQAQTISVIWPLTDQTTLPNTRGSTWCDENFYTPGHQIYNIWSYDHTALGDNGFQDLGEKILVKSTTGGTQIDMRMSENSEATRSSGYHNQISAGMEYSFKSELKIPFVGSVFDFSFRAYANGSYAHESLSTFSTGVTEDTGVSISYPSIASLSEIKAYLYWAKAGYLVVDYQTLPSSQQLPWSRYQKPDPAFILPWYGFPDPADQVAPICGDDKMLFSHDIEIDPAYVQNGDTVTITATVRNFSSNYATLPSQVSIWFYQGYPEADQSNKIGGCTISGSSLNRTLGPQQCTTSWVVSGGSGDEKIHAVIDPLNAFAEMHEGSDLINNNIGYGLLHVANADYQDPGLREKQAYQSILYEDLPGLGFGLYLPTTNNNHTFRYELAPTDLGDMRSVGSPIQVLAFPGGALEPDVSLTFSPTPAGMVVSYRDADLLPGMVEADLKLYRLGILGWVEATCPGYDLYRFVEDNILVVPICQAGTFVLSDRQPMTDWRIYLPSIIK